MSKATPTEKGRAFIAHDRVVSIVRMYLQMASVGAVLGALIYSARHGSVSFPLRCGTYPRVTHRRWQAPLARDSQLEASASATHAQVFHFLESQKLHSVWA